MACDGGHVPGIWTLAGWNLTNTLAGPLARPSCTCGLSGIVYLRARPSSENKPSRPSDNKVAKQRADHLEKHSSNQRLMSANGRARNSGGGGGGGGGGAAAAAAAGGANGRAGRRKYGAYPDLAEDDDENEVSEEDEDADDYEDDDGAGEVYHHGGHRNGNGGGSGGNTAAYSSMLAALAKLGDPSNGANNNNNSQAGGGGGGGGLDFDQMLALAMVDGEVDEERLLQQLSEESESAMDDFIKSRGNSSICCH